MILEEYCWNVWIGSITGIDMAMLLCRDALKIKDDHGSRHAKEVYQLLTSRFNRPKGAKGVNQMVFGLKGQSAGARWRPKMLTQFPVTRGSRNRTLWAIVQPGYSIQCHDFQTGNNRGHARRPSRQATPIEYSRVLHSIMCQTPWMFRRYEEGSFIRTSRGRSYSRGSFQQTEVA